MPVQTQTDSVAASTTVHPDTAFNQIHPQLQGGRTMTIATDRATALGATTDDLGQAGLIFNDAVRLSTGLWSSPADSSNQLNSASMYEADIGILKADIASAIANGATVNSTAVTPSSATTLTDIQTQLNDLAAAAPNAVGNSA